MPIPIRYVGDLGQSKNVVMARVLQAMGVDYAAGYLQRFGFPGAPCVHQRWVQLNAGGARLCAVMAR